MGYRYLNTGTAVPVFAAEPPLATEGSLYYNSTSDIFYICNGTQWNLVSNASPSATGGTRTIDALSEGGTFSYDLGDDFTDDVDTDAQLTYTLASGTLPSGCTLPTTGNSAFTGTASVVSSNTNYTWTIKVTDTSGGTATQDYQQTINTVAPTSTGGTVTISTVNEGSSASYDVDTNFSYPTGSTFSAYSLQSGSLPSGLSLNTSSGVISGTMGEVASTTAYSFTIRATDTDGDTADQAYSWTITNVPLSATGGTITTYSSGGVNYKVNTFTSGGTITFNKAGSVDVLLVAGGGGGGQQVGGGGGAGGLLFGTTSVSAQAYTINIGNGGGGAPSSSTSASNGGNTTAFGATAIGGGKGGNHNGSCGNVARGSSAGGSGGGGGSWGGYHGACNTGAPANQGNSGGLTGYGNAGGNGRNGDWAGGGGGGAGAGGYNSPSADIGGDGGAGKQYSISGTATWYAGGGGGSMNSQTSASYYSLGGSGIGGRGFADNGQAINGTTHGDDGAVNTGSGGGGVRDSYGSSNYTRAGNGSSGIVIVRYLA